MNTSKRWPQVCLMCGPTIAVARSHAPGMNLYCPTCTGEYETHAVGTKLELVATGKKGSPADLEPKLDQDVINDVVRTAARALLA